MKRRSGLDTGLTAVQTLVRSEDYLTVTGKAKALSDKATSVSGQIQQALKKVTRTEGQAKQQAKRPSRGSIVRHRASGTVWIPLLTDPSPYFASTKQLLCNPRARATFVDPLMFRPTPVKGDSVSPLIG